MEKEKEKYPQRMRSRSSRATYYAEHIGWHIQNLNDRKDGGLGPIWRHGRVWFRLGGPKVQLYWSVGGRFCHLRLAIGGGDESGIVFSLGVPFVGLFGVHFEKFLSDRWMPGRMVDSQVRPDTQFKMVEERQIGVTFSGQSLHLDLWYNPWKWHKSDPWWWRISWAPLDTFFGKTKYSTRELGTSDEAVHLPEADYPVRVRLFYSTWKRPRWPKTQRLLRAEVEAISPIPSHAGKGENDWDMDDERLYSITLPAETKQEAIDKTAAAIQRDRQRYGAPQEQRAKVGSL